MERMIIQRNTDSLWRTRQSMVSPFESLHDEWKARTQIKYPGELYVRDGPIDWSKYQAAPIKVMFLAKEVNCAPGGFHSRQSPEHQQDFRLLGNAFPWVELGQWTYGLIHPGASFEEATANYAESFRQCAFVNLKKTAGGRTSRYNQIRNAAGFYTDLLDKQIQLLDPNMIICCGKNFVYDIARKYLASATDLSSVAPDVYLPGLRIWVNFIHPSKPGMSRQAKYELLMNTECCSKTWRTSG